MGEMEIMGGQVGQEGSWGDPGAKLEEVWGGGGCDTPPKYESSGLAGQIIWIGRAVKDFK